MAKHKRVLKTTIQDFKTKAEFHAFRKDLDNALGRGNIRFHLVHRKRGVGIHDIEFTKKGKETYQIIKGLQTDPIAYIAPRHWGGMLYKHGHTLTTRGFLKTLYSEPGVIPFMKLERQLGISVK